MPPQARISREMILKTVLRITRETGFETVNARSIAGKLQCSTRPIFTCYANMEALKRDFLAFAYTYYEQYVEQYRHAAQTGPLLVLPLSYIAFAQEEANLFQLLFVDDMELSMTQAKDFYREPGNEKKAALFAQAAGIGAEPAKGIFLDLFLYAHGIAVLTATKKLALERGQAEKMVGNCLSAWIEQEKRREQEPIQPSESRGTG